MGRQKRPYPLGKLRLRLPKHIDPTKKYPVVLEYTWNRQAIRKTTNVCSRSCDWNPKENQGRGGLRASYGEEYKRLNTLLLSIIEKNDRLVAEFYHSHPNQITTQVIADILADKPLSRKDGGNDFIAFSIERLEAEYLRNKIGRSRLENGKSSMNIFREFLISTGSGTYKNDSIYLGDLSIPLIEKYIQWRKDIKRNSDATINHALTPIIKACSYAAEMGLIDQSLNARIKDMRIAVKYTVSDDETAFDGKYLSVEQLKMLIEYHSSCTMPRRREFIEMFLFAYHACGLRLVDVMTLQWTNINFVKRTLQKVLIKTNQRHSIPLTDNALNILNKWHDKNGRSRFVFNLVKEDLMIDNNEELYKARNNATKCINQSLVIVGEHLGLPFPLTMHVARHTFAVHALNKGLSMSVVSRLLGHASTDVTEKVYAKYLPETLAVEVEKLNNSLATLSL